MHSKVSSNFDRKTFTISHQIDLSLSLTQLYTSDTLIWKLFHSHSHFTGAHAAAAFQSANFHAKITFLNVWKLFGGNSCNSTNKSWKLRRFRESFFVDVSWNDSDSVSNIKWQSRIRLLIVQASTFARYLRKLLLWMRMWTAALFLRLFP